MYTFLGKYEESSEAGWDQEMSDAEGPQVAAPENVAQFIPELLKYREHIQEILNVIIKVSDNNEHAYAFRKEEKAAFEKICEIKPELTAEHLANFFGKFLHRKSVEKYSQKEAENMVLDKGIDLFRCIKALDIFEGFYRQELSVRLLNK